MTAPRPMSGAVRRSEDPAEVAKHHAPRGSTAPQAVPIGAVRRSGAVDFGDDQEHPPDCAHSHTRRSGAQWPKRRPTRTQIRAARRALGSMLGYRQQGAFDFENRDTFQLGQRLTLRHGEPCQLATAPTATQPSTNRSDT